MRVAINLVVMLMTAVAITLMSMAVAMAVKPTPVGEDALFPTRAPSASVHIAEDDVRWDCATMGNRICGQVA